MVEQEFKEFMQGQVENPYYEINLHDLVTDPRRKMRVAGQYLDVAQPMRIHKYKYTHENALGVHLHSVEGNDAIVLDSLQDYFNFMLKHDALKKYEYQDFAPQNIWLRTTDKQLPLYTDAEEVTHYHEPITPIDGMYIRIYKMHSGYKKHFLYTSSGIWNVTINQWEFSGGPKTQYSSISRGPRRHGEAYYSDKLERYTGRKKATTKEVQLIHSLLNPMSEVFLDIEKALKNTYGYVLRKEDLPKLVTTQAFRGAIMKEITALFPSLKKTIKETIDEKKIAQFLLKMMDNSLEKETSTEQKIVAEYIIELAHSETTHVSEAGVPIPIGEPVPVSQIGEGDAPGMEDAIPSVEDEAAIMNDIVSPEEAKKEEVEMDDEERMKLRDDYAIPHSSILDDIITPIADDEDGV